MYNVMSFYEPQLSQATFIIAMVDLRPARVSFQ